MQTTATLKNGLEVSIREIRADDRDRLGRAFRGLRRETVYTRFFRYVDEPTEAQLKRATEFDPQQEMALIVTTGGSDEIIIAGGRYIASAHDRTSAEIAFLVEEDYQGLGIAGLLLHTLADIGRGRGLKRFEAEVLSENGSMLRVFSRTGWPMRQRREGGVVHIELSL
jgi:RimJ/RimL family protein N-acetyltransferase